jgi:DNA-binding winged helix-turn-helix (wHTH) protein
VVVATAEPNSNLPGASVPESSAAGLGRADQDLACSFAGFRLEADGTLWRGAAVVHLPPKELAALLLLLASAGQVVSPQQLKRALWGDVHVTAESLPKCLSSLRARLEPDALIQTVYKRGYRFIGEIRHPSAASPKTLLRLAILPFTTGYMVPEHIGLAMAEETAARLAGAHPPAVAILARDSVFNLALRGFTPQQIGQELKADLVLTGSVLSFGSYYRLHAGMLRAEDGAQIWAEDLLVEQKRIGGLEWELVQRLAWRLGVALPSERSWPSPWADGTSSENSWPLGWNEAGLQISAAAASAAEDERGPREAEAYEFFLRGHHEWQTLHRHRMQDGLQHLLRAVELDPSLIAAKIDLAHLCITEALYGFMPPAVSAELVHRMADSIPDHSHRADALLPALGWVNFHFDRNLPAALRAFSHSAHLPHDPWATRARTMFAVSRHRFAEALALLRAAIVLDPYSPWLQSRLAWALHLDGQEAESMEQVRACVELFPNHEGTGLYGSAILAFNGETELAIELAQELAKRQPYFDPATAVLAYALACGGQQEEARGILERLQWLGRERYIVRGFTPAAYLALGDQEAALAELRAVDEARCPLFFQVLADPRLKALHGHPDFERMRAILPAMEAEAALQLQEEE